MKAHSNLRCDRPASGRGNLADFARLGFWALWAIAVLGLGVAVRAAKPAAPHSPTPPPSYELQFVKSVFVATPAPGFGKDLFFPRTLRFGHIATNTVEQPGPVGFLRLNGISGSRNRRLAIINYRTFATGEEADLKINGLAVRVRCLEIRDDGVTVSVSGQTQKLFLIPK